MAAVAITQDLVIEQAMTEALHHLELEALIRGKLVAVKPNNTWASAEDTTATGFSMTSTPLLPLWPSASRSTWRSLSSIRR